MSLKHALLLGASLYLFAANPVVLASPSDPCALPSGLRDEISKKYPETRLASLADWGFRTMAISAPGHADHRFRDDSDHDSGMMPITRSGMIPIS